MANIRIALDILKRYHKVVPANEPDINKMIDLEKSNVNQEALLKADDETFFHDCNGIFNYINRETGELERCFVPRVGFYN